MDEETAVAKKKVTALDILSCDDTRMTPVEVPEWKCIVYVRTLTAGDAMVFANSKDVENFAIGKALIKSLVNEDGEPIFSEDHLEALKKKSLVVCVRLANLITKLNNLDEGKEEAKKG